VVRPPARLGLFRGKSILFALRAPPNADQRRPSLSLGAERVACRIFPSRHKNALDLCSIPTGPSQRWMKYKDTCDANSGIPVSSQQSGAKPQREARYLRVAVLTTTQVQMSFSPYGTSCWCLITDRECQEGKALKASFHDMLKDKDRASSILSALVSGRNDRRGGHS